MISINDWIKKTDDFLKVNDEQVLNSSGEVTHLAAIEKAEHEYNKFRIKQDQYYVSNFDKHLSSDMKDKVQYDNQLDNLTTAAKKLKSPKAGKE